MGYEIWWAVTDQYVDNILHVNRGHRLSLQDHEQNDATSYLLSGRLLLIQGESIEALSEREAAPGETWHNGLA